MADWLGVDVPENTRDLERWRAVPGYEGFYEVSDQGCVRGIDRLVSGVYGYPERRPGVFLSAKPDQYGYVTVSLYRDRKRRRCGVHHLVLEAFVGPRPDGHYALHNDGDRANNRLGNLRWGTPSDNNHDQVRHGTHPEARRDRCDRGHLFEAPNLKQTKGKRRRACLACHNAAHLKAQALRAGEPFDFQGAADAQYERIMSGAPSKTRCPRGHPLVEPNLMPSQLARGKRSCLACARAHRKCHVSSETFKAIADGYYAQLMT